MKFIDKLMHKLSSMLKNGGNNWSSVRFAFLLCVIFSNFSFWGIWSALSIYKGSMQTIPESLIVIYALANGISYVGKIGQKRMEIKK